MAATSEEIGRQPIQRWILDLPIVMYRKLDGGIVALDDRCPHRWAPPSRGWIESDDIVCGYHGFQFCPEGDCVKVPTQATSARTGVRAYPVIEQGPLVWIWTGDPALSHQAVPPMIPWLEEDGWSRSHGYMEIAANYMLLKENVLDLTHFGFDISLAPEEMEGFAKLTLAGFEEDRAMLAAIQELLERDPCGSDYPEVMLNTDKPPAQARRQL